MEASQEQVATTARQSHKREQRRRAILDAAEQLFTEQGVAKVSLGAIVALSGGSLATVYDMFGNKAGLLRAVVERHHEEAVGQWLDDISADEPPSQVLRRAAERGHAFITSRRTIAIMRVVIGHSLDDPEFGRAYHRWANEEVYARLAALFREWTAAGKAKIDDPEAAVALLSAIVACNAPLNGLLGIGPGELNSGSLDWRLETFLQRFQIQ